MKKLSLMKHKKYVIIVKKFFITNKKDKKTFRLYHKVRDHCHYTEKFRRAAYSICNVKCKTPNKIPVVVHNRSTYDNHFII